MNRLTRTSLASQRFRLSTHLRWGDQIVKRILARLLFGVAKQFFKRRVAQLDARRQIFDNDGQRTNFNQRIEEAGALFQLLLGPAPFGDVQERDHGSHDLLAADDGMGPILYGKTGSIAAPEEFVVHVPLHSKPERLMQLAFRYRIRSS